MTTDCKYLKRRINEIEKNFIAPSMRTSLRFTERQTDLIRSYRVLCHAELESYFENIATVLITKAQDKWQRFRVANYNLASLLVYSEKIDQNATPLTKVLKAIEDYKKIIRSNNGVKQENIKKLFLPLGYMNSDFDSAWLASLSSYGADRGIIAHTSKKTQSGMDAGTEVATINIILSGILDFERVLGLK